MKTFEPRQRGSLVGCLAVAFLFLALVPGKVRAGAWVREPNHFAAMMSVGFYQSSDYFNYAGDKRPNQLSSNPGVAFAPLLESTYQQVDGSLYLEYGLPFDFELNLTFPFVVQAEQQTSVGTYSVVGISDMTFGVKYKWFERSWLLSAFEFDVGVPAGSEAKTANVAGQPSQQIPLGDGEWDFAFRMIASRGFQEVPVYVTADFGYRLRDIEFGNAGHGSDDLPWSVEGGYTFDFKTKWLGSLTPFFNLSGVVSLGTLTASDALVIGTSTVVTGRAPNQEFIEIRPGVFAKVYGPLSFGLNYTQTLMGKNTGAGWGIRTGFMWEQ